MLAQETMAQPDEREAKLTSLYQSVFPAVAKFVAKRGGSLEQAKDIFQDALVVWYEKQRDAESPELKSDKAYIFAVAKYLWFRRFSDDSSTVFLDEFKELDLSETEDVKVSRGRLLRLLESSGKRCMDLLKSFYYDKLSMSELARGLGFSTERSATVQKYKCLEKVRDTIKEKALTYEDFLE